jgi:peptide/nickel transport system permease protein
VEAEHAMGARYLRVVLRAILPNILSPLVVQATLTIAAAILLESGLSFLGLGIVPPEPSWGQMIGTARGYLSQNPMYVVWPSVCLALTVLAINVLGDALRDHLDPRLREN